MTNRYLFITATMLMIGIFISLHSIAQDDMLDMFEDEPSIDITTATFKTTRVVNAHSIENVAPGEMLFLISHRFGRLNSGSYELFGLDQSTIRLGLEFGITKRLNVGIARSTMNKTIDGFVKYKLLQQSSGLKNIPITLSYFGAINMNGLKWSQPERENLFTSRLSYINQLLIARKFNKSISIQITPTHIHNNLVILKDDPNDVFALGVGGRFKITNRITLNGEYFYMITPSPISDVNNVLSVGVDIETGGHVFQLIFSNSQSMYNKGFITETTGSWGAGDIYFGFNISRMFTL